MQDLRDKVAVVTGGGSGIGRALCIELSDAGSKVAVCDLEETGAKRTVESIKARNGVATAHCVDVSSEANMRSLVDDVLRMSTVVDIVVNNAACRRSQRVRPSATSTRCLT